MIELFGSSFPCCDGLHRRSFLRIGSLTFGGLTLPELLRLRSEAAAAGKPQKKTSVIYIELAGGPSQIETYDPKPDAPAEYRGPCGAVSGCIAGERFCDVMPEQAKIMDRLSIIRSVFHERNSHDPSSHLTQTGYYKDGRKNGPNEMPSIGSITAKIRGPNEKGLPSYVGVPRTMRNGQAAYLGAGYNPFESGGNPNSDRYRVNNLGLVRGLTAGRLGDRSRLLNELDATSRVMDTTGVAESVDHFGRAAFELVSGNRARRAFDIGAESDKLRERYGRSTTGQSLLLARRLVESGVTFVSVRAGGWDNHKSIQKAVERNARPLDQGIAALVGDLHDRGMQDDVLIVAMGEFGRTPRVNRNAGRDHWGAVMSVLVAGGGFKMGQIIGKSDSKGAVPVEKPYRPEHVLASIYHHLGIDTSMTFADSSGRPRYVLETDEIIQELI